MVLTNDEFLSLLIIFHLRGRGVERLSHEELTGQTEFG